MGHICVMSPAKKFSVVMLFTASLSLFSIQPASAVFDVKDAESIAKLTQIAATTVENKTALTTQINAMLKDMGVIDEKTYKKFQGYIDAVNKAANKILWTVDNSDFGSIVFNSDGTVTQTITGFSGEKVKITLPKMRSESDIGNILLTCLPAIGTPNKDGSVDVGLSAKQRAWISAVGYVMKSNRHTLTLYNKLNNYLLQYQNQLDQLLIENGKIQHGTVEAQQIGNQISYVRGRIEQIRSAMTALDSQQSIVKAHAEAQREVNENIAKEAQEKEVQKSVDEAATRIEKVDELRASNDSYRAMMKGIPR